MASNITERKLKEIMAESRESRDVRDLKEILAKAKTFREKEIIRREEWGSLNFDYIEEEVIGILDLCEDLETMDLKLVESESLKAAKWAIESVVKTLTQMDQFSIDTLDTGIIHTVNEIWSRFPNETQQVRSACIPWMGYLAYRRGDIQGKIQEVESAITQLKEERREERERWERERTEELDKIRKDGAAKIQELERTLVAARHAAADIGVVGFTEEFQQEAERAERESRWWLVVAIILSLFTVGILVSSKWWSFYMIDSNAALWEAIGIKAGVVVLMVYASSWCARMYKVVRHQSTTNRHRALSLKTFNAFSQAASSEETREAILLAAGKCIFESRNTGLTEERGNMPISTTQIIETARKTVDSRGSP